VLSDVRPVIAAIDRTISAMGYELVDVEFAGAGLLRVYIDLPASAFEQVSVPANSPEAPMIKVEDCERVSHQLTHFLTVENIDYSRLEVSSPGLDRPLKREADFARFEGAEVSLRLREPLSGRRNFVGVLMRDESAADRWALELIESPKVAAKRAGSPSSITKVRYSAMLSSSCSISVMSKGRVWGFMLYSLNKRANWTEVAVSMAWVDLSPPPSITITTVPCWM
jgi:ribosome maturation factor RimP